MTLENILAVAAIALTVLGVVWEASRRFSSQEERLNGLKDDVDRLNGQINIINKFILRMAMAEAVEKGGGKVNSPFTISRDANEWFKPIAKELRRLRKSLTNVWGREPSDAEMFYAIEKRYGKWLLDNICIPHGYDSGGCIAMAIAVSKEEPANMLVSV